MDLDRRTLAKIDRKLLSGLDQDEAFQMVRVPVTAAKWSTWKRYCDVVGISMGRAIAALIDRELVSVFGESGHDDMPVFEGEAEKQLAAQEEVIAAHERGFHATEEGLRGWGGRLRLWEDELREREQQVELTAKLSARSREASPKVGRNERCQCGSGLKFKRCHGLGRRPD
jgi:hypothetical protein